jgi:hypothetical protein
MFGFGAVMGEIQESTIITIFSIQKKMSKRWNMVICGDRGQKKIHDKK